ncbi:MAG: class I SAM-dependent methyltransferase [candidate division Zixibacteria bacterium]|nr:class I SAM-dependent methyltransferase [candidate division Zixibacteria bacterium]
MRPSTVSPIRMNSTNYYDLNADALAARYDGVDPADVHADWAPAHLREEPGFACDIGAGSGRDANWLAARGWEVVAVEPSALRNLATERAHPRVVWMEDALPDLRALRALGRRFDLILLSAVWMHVAPKTRERAFRILSELLNPSGLLVITLRRGGDAAENAARGFYDTSAEEIIGYANRRAIALRGHSTQPDLTRPGIHWETLVFAMPDDGTGSLPLLRHVIVNDNKSATYKLGLLRTLVRLAESAPGLVIDRTDDYVEIPFGAVGLYWLKQYLPLVLHHRLPQRPSGPGGYGWAKEAFYQLQDVSPSDLRLGARFDADRAVILTRAINDACENIQLMPIRYITFPGSDDRQLFESGFSRMRATSRPIVLSREYLARFGRFRIPAMLWQALGQFACWLDPVIVGEWRQLSSNWVGPANQRNDLRRAANVGQSAGQSTGQSAGLSSSQSVGQPSLVREAGTDTAIHGADTATNDPYEWTESRYDTGIAQERAKQLRDDGFALTCVWSDTRIRNAPHIDHCFPWARWRNNDLWNLLPAHGTINLRKSDRLPSSSAMADARDRMLKWWANAWVHSPQEERFFMEARYSLPGLDVDTPGLEDIFTAAQHQRARLKQDQQLIEWPT